MQIEHRSFKVYVFALIISLLLVLFVVRSEAFSCWDFRNNLWGPAYLLVHQQSPYRVDLLFDLGNAVWMPMAIGVFFPLGFLSLQQASNLWFVFNLIWFLLLLWISCGSRRPAIYLFGLAILLGFLFPPSVTHLWTGQISILITLIFLTIGRWNDRIPPLLLAALMALGLSKPQLAVLVLPGFLIYRLKESGWRQAAQLVVYLAGSILLFTVPLFLAYPDWFPDFLVALQKNPSWAQPSSLSFLRSAVPQMGGWIWIGLALILFAVNIWLWLALPVRDAVYWSLALTPLVSPYIWTWDFVMILPLCISHLFQAKAKASLAILLGGYAACWGLMTTMKLRGEVSESLFWWVPWCLLAIILASRYLKIQFDPRQNLDQLPE